MREEYKEYEEYEEYEEFKELNGGARIQESGASRTWADPSFSRDDYSAISIE
jgi:hypothetical protein